ncbi:MAG: hypothetical protein HY848_18360 [Betaproteobacteria bacterium]|nr:hypothetical protein [Betaproteobacteria bacterium]
MLEPRGDVHIPDLEDPLFAPFWQGTAAGGLRVQQCPKCKAVYWPRAVSLSVRSKRVSRPCRNRCKQA